MMLRIGLALYGLVALAVIVVGLLGPNWPVVAVGFGLCLLPLLVLTMRRYGYAPHAVLAFVLGAMPFASIPGTGTQIALYLAPVVAVLVFMSPERSSAPLGALAWSTIVFLVLAAFASAITYSGVDTVIQFVKWTIGMAFVFVLIVAGPMSRRVLYRSYGYGAAIGGAIAIVMAFADRQGRVLSALSWLGYGSDDLGNVRSAEVGSSDAVRASGLYIDPNAAGLFLLVGVAAVAVAFRGRRRVILLAIIMASVVATLSRAAIASLLVAAVVAIVAARMHASSRIAFVGVGLLGAIAVLGLPVVTDRLLSSFDSNQVGVAARIDAIDAFGSVMHGNWLFGAGWYQEAFFDEAAAYYDNTIANTTLVMVQRAGIFAGGAFVAMQLVTVLQFIASMRRGVAGAALAGGVAIGMMTVAFQADYPVATMPVLAMAFAFLIAIAPLLLRPDVETAFEDVDAALPASGPASMAPELVTPSRPG